MAGKSSQTSRTRSGRVTVATAKVKASMEELNTRASNSTKASGRSKAPKTSVEDAEDSDTEDAAPPAKRQKKRQTTVEEVPDEDASIAASQEQQAIEVSSDEEDRDAESSGDEGGVAEEREEAELGMQTRDLEQDESVLIEP